MPNTEAWETIDEFPMYAVSDQGRIINKKTELIKVPTVNQQGIPSVQLIRDHQQFRRSIAPLVARAFIPPPPRDTFDTPINLDGDRFNNVADNLAWRPRWFARKYHLQFLERPAYTGGLEVVETGEKFVHLRDCSTKYGLLEKEIILAAHNSVPVFPTWQTFRFCDA